MTTLRRDSSVASPLAEYGTEVLCAGWNPAASLAVPEVSARARQSADDVSDVESFLAQFYRLQQA